jgi:hypothetical protein
MWSAWGCDAMRTSTSIILFLRIYVLTAEEAETSPESMIIIFPEGDLTLIKSPWPTSMTQTSSAPLTSEVCDGGCEGDAEGGASVGASGVVPGETVVNGEGVGVAAEKEGEGSQNDDEQPDTASSVATSRESTQNFTEDANDFFISSSKSSLEIFYYRRFRCTTYNCLQLSIT